MRIDNSIVFSAQSKLNLIPSNKWIIIIPFINIMCNSSSDWGTRIQPLAQVIIICPAAGT